MFGNAAAGEAAEQAVADTAADFAADTAATAAKADAAAEKAAADDKAATAAKAAAAADTAAAASAVKLAADKAKTDGAADEAVAQQVAADKEQTEKLAANAAADKTATEGASGDAGLDAYVEDLPTVDSRGVTDQAGKGLGRINQRSPDIAGGVLGVNEELDVGVDVQGSMLGHAGGGDSMVMAAGETTPQAKIDYEKAVAESGFASYVDRICINKQSPDIVGGVVRGTEDFDGGSRDEGIMEKLRQNDVEVLYMKVPIDEFGFQQLKAFDGVNLTSTTKDGLEFEDEGVKKKSEDFKSGLEPTKLMKMVLGDNVEKATIVRMTDSPCVLATPEHGGPANVELTKAQAMRDNSMAACMVSEKHMAAKPNHSTMTELSVDMHELWKERRLKDSVNTQLDHNAFPDESHATTNPAASTAVAEKTDEQVAAIKAQTDKVAANAVAAEVAANVATHSMAQRERMQDMVAKHAAVMAAASKYKF